MSQAADHVLALVPEGGEVLRAELERQAMVAHGLRAFLVQSALAELACSVLVEERNGRVFVRRRGTEEVLVGRPRR